eukprot:13870559-Ditylum_brightwellii.AAC.1
MTWPDGLIMTVGIHYPSSVKPLQLDLNVNVEKFRSAPGSTKLLQFICCWKTDRTLSSRVHSSDGLQSGVITILGPAPQIILAEDIYPNNGNAYHLDSDHNTTS